MLEWRQRVRMARLYKGGAPGSVAYQIVQEGVRPVPTAVRSAPDQPEEEEEAMQPHEYQWPAQGLAPSSGAQQPWHGRAY
jgi:hypothetical protein